jgi:hypothetical protein
MPYADPTREALVGFRAASPLQKKETPGEAPGVEVGLSLCLIQADEMTYSIHDAAPEARSGSRFQPKTEPKGQSMA